MSKKFIACGLMSGTSKDGIDVATVEIGGRFPNNTIRLVNFETQPYLKQIRERLLLLPECLTAEDVATLDFAIGRQFGEAALSGIENAGLKPAEVSVIGSHGQTLVHRPRGVRFGRGRLPSTLQVGSGAVIAQTTGIPTVTDFRSADVAVGGEGAPLVPVFDYVMLRSRKHARIALNIGGIANLTAVPLGARPTDVLAFDTGPGNCMIDIAVRVMCRSRSNRRGAPVFDWGGAMAMAGEPDESVLGEILSHSYFRRKPPKSTGWNEFGDDFVRPLIARMRRRRRVWQDILRTMTDATCESITRAIRDFVWSHITVGEIVVTGGGVYNRALMKGLRSRLPEVTVATGEAYGMPPDAKEAMAFAYLAYLHLRGIPANIVSQASGLKPAILGALYPGRRY